MNASRDTRINHLSVCADLALPVAGTEIFGCPTKKGGRGAVRNLRHGQLVIVDPATGLAVDDSNIAGYDNVERLIFGLGIDSSGRKGQADVIRRSAGDEFFGCTLDYINAQAPVCGTPHIKDIFFKCVQPCEVYSLKISWEDFQTRSEEPWNRNPHITASFKTSCGECDECAPEASCSDLACGLVADFENNLDDIDWDWAGKGGNDAPLKLVRLFGGAETTKVFCITPQDTECENCLVTDPITEFTFKGETFTLEGTVDPADPSVTLLSQLELVVDQINEELCKEGEGFAVLTKGVGKCCEYQLHVNSCDPAFAITGLTPCISEDPTANVTLPITCGDCASPAQEQVWNCGIRVIAEPVVVECGCYGPNPLPIFFGRNVHVEPVGDGWADSSTYVREYQEMSIPENFGAQVYEMEYYADNGGWGRTHNDWVDFRGPKGTHSNDGRASAVMAKCDYQYCTWDIGHKSPHTQYGIDGTVNPVPFVTRVAIPDSFANAKSSWEAFLAAYITELGPRCPKVKSVLCADSYTPNGRRV